MWDDSDNFSMRIHDHSSTTCGEYGQTRPLMSTPGGAIGGFLLILVAAIMFGIMGAPGWFIGLALLIGFISLVGGLAASKSEAERARQAEEAETEARERFKEEVAQSVKDSLKGNIKVRCRYCGGLNGEHDEKCESCGAPL